MKDATGQALAYVCAVKSSRGISMKRGLVRAAMARASLTRSLIGPPGTPPDYRRQRVPAALTIDEARRVASNIAKLPTLLSKKNE